MTPQATDDDGDELEHDETCTCEVCEREAHARVFERMQRAVAVGGIAPWAHEALGPGWLDADGKGGTTVEPINTADLAQRALGEVFEHVERVAKAGRDRCAGGNPYSSEPFTDATRIARDEARALLRMLADSLDYARVHLDYLKRPANENAAADACTTDEGWGVGDQVLITDDENTWQGEITGFIPAHEGHGEAMVRDGHGKTHPVDMRDLRKVAV